MGSLFEGASESMHQVSILDFALRMLVAIVLGMGVAWFYSKVRTGHPVASTFPATLLMLCVLIAMVTYVIGDSVARAFSLVGAISIVRFRTVVEDTYDITYVIFAVVLGMAVGSGYFVEAILGFAIIAASAWFTQPSNLSPLPARIGRSKLRIRTDLNVDPMERLVPELEKIAENLELVGSDTARGGTALDWTYNFRMRPGHSPEIWMRQLHQVEGVVSVDWSESKS